MQQLLMLCLQFGQLHIELRLAVQKLHYRKKLVGSPFLIIGKGRAFSQINKFLEVVAFGQELCEILCLLYSVRPVVFKVKT